MAALHLLRLVQDQDRPVLADDVDGLSRLEIVEFLVDPPRVLAAGAKACTLMIITLIPASDEKLSSWCSCLEL